MEEMYRIEFEHSDVIIFKCYLNYVCTYGEDFNAFFLEGMLLKLQDYNNNFDNYKFDKYVLINKINIKTFKLYLALFLNEISGELIFEGECIDIGNIERDLNNLKRSC